MSPYKGGPDCDMCGYTVSCHVIHIQELATTETYFANDICMEGGLRYI